MRSITALVGELMKKYPFFGNRIIRTYFILHVGNLFFVSSSLGAQEVSPLRNELQYYPQLKNEEFLQTMIPKEKFLLGIIQSVNEEMEKRRSEGARIADLGIEEVISPGDIIGDEYGQELQRVVRLLDEIVQLEKKAKQQVDLEALEVLSGLKKNISEILDSGNLTDRVEQLTQGFDVIQKEEADSSDRENVSESSDLEDQVGIKDLYEQWKYNSILDYKVVLTEHQFLRMRLLKTATPSQERRMFQRDLKKALESYSYGDFPVSRLLLQDILDTYSYRLMDDVLYYSSESSYGLNYFDEALESYHRLVTEYPESSFCAKGLVKLIYIYYIYGEFDKVSKAYQQLLIKEDYLDSESLSTISYLVAYAHFKAGAYDKALEYLANVPTESTYFFPSLYLSAACYSNLGKDNLALSLYQRLIVEKNKGKNDPVLAQIKDNILLKLGLIYYERGDNKRATQFFNLVSKDFQHYDLSVIGKAWSAYRSGRPGEALRSVEWVLRNSMVSNYAYEARVLAANSKILLGHTEEAIEDLKQVYQLGSRVDQIEKNPSDKMSSLEGIVRIEEYQARFLDEREREMFSEIEQIRRFLQSSSFSEDPSDSGKTESNNIFTEETQRLTKKIEALDRLEEQARESETKLFIEDIRRLRRDFIQILEEHTKRFSGRMLDPIEDPLIRRMGMAEYFKYIFRSLLLETIREKEQTKKNIRVAEELLEEARQQDKFEYAIRMEVKKEELEDYYGRLNQYEVWLRENFPQELRVELERWTTFSGFGISNINFSRIKETEERITQISRTIGFLDQVFKAKRKELENRIQGLLSDVAMIEEQMRQEAERREQREKDRFFKAEYFERQRQESVTGKLREKPETEKGKVKK